MVKHLYDDPLDRLAAENPDYARARHGWAYAELESTLRLARIRCLGPAAVVARMAGILDDSDRDDLLVRLGELKLTHEHIRTVANVVRRLASYGDTLPSREKARADATIARIIRTLPKETANELIKPFLDHPRRARWEIAYKSLKHIGVTVDLAQHLIANFRRTGDERMLELIARTDDVVAEVAAEFVIQNLSEEYWRTRVLEALLHRQPQRAVELVGDYPKEFIWAVGRVKANSHLVIIERIFAANKNNIKLLSIYAWALGQLRAVKQLERLNAHVRQTWPGGHEAFLPIAVT
jgi:hypothetical protein